MTVAEVRCPMCGKPNPAELEICQFCQARLKPLVISQPESPTQEPGDEPAENTASDWLVSLRAKDSSLGEPEEVGEEEQINLPGWLKSSTPEPAQGAANQPEGESADWLASFRGNDLEPNETVAPEGMETEAAPAEPTPKPGEEGSPDWLEAIRKDTGPFEPTEPATSGTPQATEGDPNWLERIRARRFQEDIYTPLQPDEEQQDAESLEDWLRREMGEAASGAVPTTNYEPLDYAAEAALAKNIAEPSPEIEQTPTQTRSDEPVTAELPQESIDWLSGANASPVTPEERQLPAGEAEAEPAEHGMPSWISRKSEKPGEAAILAAGIASNVDQGIDQTGDLPDWLTGIGQGSDLPEAALGQTDELPPESQEELPAELPAASLAQEGTEEGTRRDSLKQPRRDRKRRQVGCSALQQLRQRWGRLARKRLPLQNHK